MRSAREEKAIPCCCARASSAGKLGAMITLRNLCRSPTRTALATSGFALSLPSIGWGGDHFAARGLEQLFLAVGDVEETIAVRAADIAGMKPAVGFNHIPCRFPACASSR